MPPLVSARRRQDRLAVLGDVILGAGFNITAIQDPEEIERFHFLDSLSLLEIDAVAKASDLVDLGSGAGLPALVLALALPQTRITAVESQRKKCAHIETAAGALGLENVSVCCQRAEEYGRSAGQGSSRGGGVESARGAARGGRVLAPPSAPWRLHGGDEGLHLRPRAHPSPESSRYTGCRQA